VKYVFPRTVYRHQNHHKREVTAAWIQNYFAALAAAAWMMAQNNLPVVDHPQRQ
jgi:hypothetical protein